MHRVQGTVATLDLLTQRKGSVADRATLLQANGVGHAASCSNDELKNDFFSFVRPNTRAPIYSSSASLLHVRRILAKNFLVLVWTLALHTLFKITRG